MEKKKNHCLKQILHLHDAPSQLNSNMHIPMYAGLLSVNVALF